MVLVGAGVLLVRGLKKPADPHALWFALGIAGVIASYTLLDKRGITHANPITYLELSMVPAALGYALGVLTVRGRTGMRAELNVASILAGVRVVRSVRTRPGGARARVRGVGGSGARDERRDGDRLRRSRAARAGLSLAR